MFISPRFEGGESIEQSKPRFIICDARTPDRRPLTVEPIVADSADEAFKIFEANHEVDREDVTISQA